MRERIDGRVDERCMTDKMNKHGCSVETNGAPAPFCLIDMDRPEAPERRAAGKCDYLFLAADSGRSGLWVVRSCRSLCTVASCIGRRFKN